MLLMYVMLYYAICLIVKINNSISDICKMKNE